MKKITTILAVVMVIASCNCSNTPQIGKSMGRWDSFSKESMVQNHKDGLDWIEVTMNNVTKMAGYEDIDIYCVQLAKEIEEAGLRVWSVHLPFSRTLDVSVLNDTARMANLGYIERMMRAAGAFKPQRFVLHPSSEPIAPEDRAQRLANSHESIGELAQVAEEMGVILCIENLPRTCLGQNAQEMLALIDGYDNVGLCFDTNHLLYQSHADYLAAIPRGKIKTVHLSDYDFTDERHWIPGRGLIDCKALWQGILDNGYDGIMMFECYGEPKELKHAREILMGKQAQPKFSANVSLDSLCFVNAAWKETKLGKGAISRTATVIPMFGGSKQSISVTVYPAKKYETQIIDCPASKSGITSKIAQDNSSVMAINGSYFNVKKLTPTTYLRKGEEVLGKTTPEEIFRVNGAVGTLKNGHKIVIAACDTTQYDAVTGTWDEVLAAGPVLMSEGKIVAGKEYGSSFFDKRHPRSIIGTDDRGNVYFVVIDGRFKGKGEGTTIYETAYICSLLGMTEALNLDGGGSSTLWTEKGGVLNHPYDNKKFDHKGERTIPNVIIAK